MCNLIKRSNTISNEEDIGLNSFFRLPQEIVEVILLRLPPKSLIKFSCLSKRCKSIIFDPKFVLHYKTSKASNLRGLLLPFVHSILYLSWWPFKYDMKCKKLKRPDMGKLDGLLFHLTNDFSRDVDATEIGHNIIASSNGLILSLFSPRLNTFEFCVSNPLTEQSVRLPPVSCGKCQWQSGFATRRTEINGAYHVSYKVVLFASQQSSTYCTVQIFSSDTGRWTNPILGLPNFLKDSSARQDFCHRGVLYWCHYKSKTIVTYDPYDTPDRFGSIRLPDVELDDSQSQMGISLVQLGQEDSVRYCAIKQHGDTSTLLVWRLVEEEWCLQRRCLVSPLCDVESLFFSHCRQLVGLGTSKSSPITYLFTRPCGHFTSIDLRTGEEKYYNLNTYGGGFRSDNNNIVAFVPVVFCPWSSPLYCQ